MAAGRSRALQRGRWSRLEPAVSFKAALTEAPCSPCCQNLVVSTQSTAFKFSVLFLELHGLHQFLKQLRKRGVTPGRLSARHGYLGVQSTTLMPQDVYETPDLL